MTAALYETSMYAGGHLLGAFAAGYWFGENVVSPLIQNYAPSLHDAIGNKIGHIIDRIWEVRKRPDQLGPAQEDAAQSFAISSYISGRIRSTGGDYGVCSAWSSWASSGGGPGFFKIY